MLNHEPGGLGVAKHIQPRFGETVPYSSRGQYVGQRRKQRKAGAGFATKKPGKMPTESQPEPPALVMPTGVLSVRASSQKLASRIAGDSHAAADDDSVRQALMDMLSADWTTPTLATGRKIRGSRADTAPTAAPSKPQMLPPIASSERATLICDPHANRGNGAIGADPPHWSGTRTKPFIPATMATKPFAAEPRHRDSRSAFALGPGDIETQVAAVAQHIRATKSSPQPARRNVVTAPTPPRRSQYTLTMPNPLPSRSAVARPTGSRPSRPLGRPRVAETSEDRARRAVAALTQRYTVQIGAAAESTQVIGHTDPTWTAAEIQRCSTHPSASIASQSAERRESKPSLPSTTPTTLPSSDEKEQQMSSRTKRQPSTARVPLVARDTKTTVAAPRQHVADRRAAKDASSSNSTCVTGKTIEKTERFGQVVEHDMAEEDGLTGWGVLDE